jgi:hypothetical protein
LESLDINKDNTSSASRTLSSVSASISDDARDSYDGGNATNEDDNNEGIETDDGRVETNELGSGGGDDKTDNSSSNETGCGSVNINEPGGGNVVIEAGGNIVNEAGGDVITEGSSNETDGISEGNAGDARGE